MQYSEEQALAAASGRFGNISRIARKLDCTRQTVYNLMERFDSVRLAIEEGREALIDLAEEHLERQVREGNMTAINSVLRGIGKSRGWSERTEVAGTDGTPLEIVVRYAADADS